MVISSFPYGSRMWLMATFKNPLTNGLVDPPAVTAKIWAPGGPLTTYVYGVNPELTKVSTGRYRCYIDCAKKGRWDYRYEGAGTYVGANELWFNIRDSAFSP